jgi:hypothetical protein
MCRLTCVICRNQSSVALSGTRANLVAKGSGALNDGLPTPRGSRRHACLAKGSTLPRCAGFQGQAPNWWPTSTCRILQARFRHVAHARGERQGLSSPCTNPCRRWRVQHRGRRHVGTAWPVSRSLAKHRFRICRRAPQIRRAVRRLHGGRPGGPLYSLNSRHRQATQPCLLRAINGRLASIHPFKERSPFFSKCCTKYSRRRRAHVFELINGSVVTVNIRSHQIQS